MELKDFIQTGLDRSRQAITRTLDGLSHYELMWRPGPDANSMGIILLHLGRAEDFFISRVRGAAPVWESGKWHEKLNLAATESGSGYTTEQIAAFRSPEAKDLLAYGDAVRQQTLACLKEMTSDKFDNKVSMGRMGELTIGGIFATIVVHAAQHSGEISYLRGLQRGLNK